MNYTILSTKDMATNQELELVKSGNKYYITLSGENELIGKKEFDEMNVALKTYNSMIEIIARGYYTYQGRKDLLESYDFK